MNDKQIPELKVCISLRLIKLQNMSESPELNGVFAVLLSRIPEADRKNREMPEYRVSVKQKSTVMKLAFDKINFLLENKTENITQNIQMIKKLDKSLLHWGTNNKISEFFIVSYLKNFPDGKFGLDFHIWQTKSTECGQDIQSLYEQYLANNTIFFCNTAGTVMSVSDTLLFLHKLPIHLFSQESNTSLQYMYLNNSFFQGDSS